MSKVQAVVKDVSTNLSGDKSTRNVIIMIVSFVVIGIIIAVFFLTRKNTKVEGSKTPIKIIKKSDVCLPPSSAPSISSFCSMDEVSTCSFLTELQWTPVNGNKNGYGALICPTTTNNSIACGGLCEGGPIIKAGVATCANSEDDIIFQKCLTSITPKKCNSSSSLPIATGVDGNVYYINAIGNLIDICGTLEAFQPEGGENI